MFAGVCVVILYGCILRPLVLRSQNSFKRATYVIPLLVGVTFFVIVYFIIQTVGPVFWPITPYLSSVVYELKNLAEVTLHNENDMLYGQQASVLQGNKNKTWTPVVGDGKAVWIAIIPSVVMTIVTFFVLIPIMTRRIEAECAALERYLHLYSYPISAFTLHEQGFALQARGPGFFFKALHSL